MGMLAEMDTDVKPKRAHILVVDDDSGPRMILSEFFSGHGCQVTLAENGMESIDRVRIDRFDLILLDVNMPVMSGDEALPHIIDQDPHVRVIIMTANASYEAKVETREMGAYDYLVKPITPAKLEEVLEKAIPGRSEERDYPIEPAKK